MVFEWDERKSKSNEAKHGISFRLAARVFDDRRALCEYNSEKDGEDRFQCIGLIKGVLVVLVVYVVRKGQANEDIHRIISARKATASEAERYHEQAFD